MATALQISEARVINDHCSTWTFADRRLRPAATCEEPQLKNRRRADTQEL